jgi:hypothetical protein
MNGGLMNARISSRPIRLVSMVALVAMCVGMAAAPAGADGPTVTATPNKKLVDQQQISVSASGFAPDIEVAIVECPTTTVSPTACDLNELNFADTDATGSFSDAPLVVARVLADGTDCALNGGCYVGAQASDGTGPTASTLIKFDPKVPAFTLTVRIDKTGTVNSKGVVGLHGTVRCSAGTGFVDVDVQLSQIVDRAIFTSFGFVETTCNGSASVPFRVTIRPGNGFFGPGAATARPEAQSGSKFVTHKVGVTLVSV